MRCLSARPFDIMSGCAISAGQWMRTRRYELVFGSIWSLPSEPAGIPPLAPATAEATEEEEEEASLG